MLAVDWTSVSLGVLGSLFVGVLLWLSLPRGIVLVKEPLPRDQFSSQPLHDTWTLQNASAVPVRLYSVEIDGPEGYAVEDGTVPLRQRFLNWRRKMPRTYLGTQLPIDQTGARALSLNLDDGVLETLRDDRQTPWNRVVIPPGERMTAIVMGLNVLRLRYRRPGPWGVLERRELVIYGHA
jgi:hypothetical protein